MNRQPTRRPGRTKNRPQPFDDPDEMLEVPTFALEEALNHAIYDLGGEAVCHLGRAYCPATDLAKWLVTLPLAQRVPRRFVLGLGYMCDVPGGEATAPFVRVDWLPNHITVPPVGAVRVRREDLRLQGLFVPSNFFKHKIGYKDKVLARPIALNAQGLEFDPSPRAKKSSGNIPEGTQPVR